MKNNTFHSLTLPLAALAFSFAAQANVVQLKSYADVRVAADPDTLVVFDLDNTVIMPTQTLGSDQWGSLMQRRFKEQGVPAQEAVDRGVALFAQVQRVTPVIPVEGYVHPFIAGLQAREVPVMALTARPLNLVDRTLQQIKGVDVDFTRSSVLDENFEMGEGAKASVYRDGVLFVGPHNNKGEMLKQFFARIGRPLPKRIIFFDDKQHHVDDMEAAMAHENTEYTGYRYGAADPAVESFDPRIGDVQWNEFQSTGRILTDSEARSILMDR